MPDNRYSPNHGWQQRADRLRATARKASPRTDGCVCEHGPFMAATWRHSVLSVALEHAWDCPLPDVAFDPGVYADTGQRVPIPVA